MQQKIQCIYMPPTSLCLPTATQTPHIRAAVWARTDWTNGFVRGSVGCARGMGGWLTSWDFDISCR